MSLSEVGGPGQRVDVLNGGDVAPDGRLLSVAEIQQAFRELRAGTPSEAASPLAPEQEQVEAAPCGGGAAEIGTDLPSGPARGRKPAVTHGADLDRAWVGVVAAHAGAGASTVALAIAD